MISCALGHWHAGFLSVPWPKQSLSALWLKQKGHLLLSWIILSPLRCKVPEDAAPLGGGGGWMHSCAHQQPCEWEHFIPFLPSEAIGVDVGVPAAPPMVTTQDTLASLAFLAGGVIFFNSGVDEPQPAGSAAAMFNASFHFCPQTTQRQTHLYPEYS